MARDQWLAHHPPPSPRLLPPPPPPTHTGPWSPPPTPNQAFLHHVATLPLLRCSRPPRPGRLPLRVRALLPSRLHLRPPHIGAAGLHRLLRLRFSEAEVHAVLDQLGGAADRRGGDAGPPRELRPPEQRDQGGVLHGVRSDAGAAAVYGLFLPLVELTYTKAKQAITDTLVMEMQMVMGFFATAFCTVGMLVNKDFQAIPREAKHHEQGEFRYYVVLVWCAILWQFLFLGTVGVIFCVNTLLAGVLIAVFIPVTEVFAVIFFKEKFGSEKGVALALSLWGLASYSYGEYREGKRSQNMAADLSNQPV
ncbi:Triose-phosphate Transporter family [Musa troglodytarum]|uniref:Probable purine permease n=1 Tax=Musa troglodytarum TaxID=320322 RepID=A0A9E7G140_9LILI|nr:Triose-phosphate Transporter family [Musa troglodytarum]